MKRIVRRVKFECEIKSRPAAFENLNLELRSYKIPRLCILYIPYLFSVRDKIIDRLIDSLILTYLIEIIV